ncbi:uncharacterized protein BJX67DRAFT_360410 [Aspergillus lucknowensis]|uniref:F-box domain-containing protein n=1 Tax=Aspergillus lucknowensis TaxID=176173 RepID=A0ABR4LJZ3_9EURO
MFSSVHCNMEYQSVCLGTAREPQSLMNILILYPVASAIAGQCNVRDVVSLSLSCKSVYRVLDSHGLALLRKTAIGCSVNCTRTQPTSILQDIALSFHRCHFCSRSGCYRPGRFESIERCLTEFRCSKVTQGRETPTTLAQHPPSYVCNRCMNEKVPESLRPEKPDSASHSHLDGLLYSSGIICHRHPRSSATNPPNPATNQVEKRCQEYHDLFGSMEDLGASVDQWMVRRADFQDRYYTELKRRYRIDWGHDMPTRVEKQTRILLSQSFGGIFLYP